MGFKSIGARLITVACVGLLLLLIGYPPRIILMRSVSGDGFTLEHYRSAFSNPKNFEEICNNLFVSSAATVLSTLIGRAVAWLVSRTDLGMRKIIHLLMLTHFFIPPFISAMACQQLLGPVGLINKWYMQISGSTDPLIHIYGQSGVLFVFTISGSVLMYMVVINSFQKVQASLEEAAIITGAGALRTLRDITLPVPGPSVLSAMILVFMSNISNYGAPSVLGYHVSYHTLTTRIYEVLQDFSLQNNMEVAAALSMLLVAVAMLSLVGKECLLTGKGFAVVTGKAEQPTRTRLGILRLPITTLTCICGLMLSAAPFLSILATSLTRAYGLPFSAANFTLNNYHTVLFAMSAFGRAMRNSMFLAFSTGGSPSDLAFWPPIFA